MEIDEWFNYRLFIWTPLFWPGEGGSYVVIYGVNNGEIDSIINGVIDGIIRDLWWIGLDKTWVI